MLVNLLQSREHKIRVISILILCLTMYILVPKISAAAITSNSFNSSYPNKVNYKVVQSKYTPPDNGAPDSEHGSGTR
ncbi:hypothetical protein VB711_06690 [Cronbergia sp. UHCC 0137]|uniref:hypothetical protein n=1 Tax=Cronbergia sp. UHCC 0137 TaxID=3110239 RepID=UPI002B1F6702|nr:hypothetical protein [Cronbergia sp. UHCC 0137]MEA5617525.1 hypothetical protein [Cronbergia sp. UHCC 0137]